MPPKRKERAKNPAENDLREDENHPPAHQPNIDDDDDESEDLLNMEIPPMPDAAIQRGGERMVISHIEVENFKSYFGRQVIGPFHKSFTSIIGPNGSGKSNVIDALLFVFGYRASKIRSKKISVLIHSSAGRDNIQSCTVTVNFCKIVDINDTEYKKIDGSDLAVSRTAHKDNSSRYTLNGRTVKFKEIGDLLRGNGIDLVHNRFLILQGEVEQISMMKPKADKEDEEGMLEYLEDIIGSSRLKEPINKLAKRIEKINDRRAIQLQRLQHAEKEKVQLEGPAREMVNQMRLENAINCITNRILLANKYKHGATIAQLKTQREQLDVELKESQEKLLNIINRSKQLTKERQKLQNQLEKSMDAVQSTEQRIGEQKQIKTKAENDSKRLESRKEKLEGEIKSEEGKLAEWEAAPEKALEKIEEYRKQKEEAEALIEEYSPILMEKLAEVREQMKDEHKAKTELESRLSKVSTIEDDLNSKLTLAQEKLLNLRREEEAQRRKYDEMHTKIMDTEELIEKRERELHATRDALPEQEELFEGKTARLGHLRERETKLANRIRELRMQYEEKRQAEEQLKGTNQVQNRLMEAKQSGEIEGILGRLGDLGAIDQKYDVTISTTCGALDNIVVEDVSTGQRCIELLKREKLGVASFIALDKQQHFWDSIRRKPKTPEDAPRLFDLIKVADEKVLPAFYFAVHDTLVADDIVAATRIGLNSGRRWRTVTLNGEVVDASGTMTGGGGQPTRGKMGRSVRIDTSQRRDEGNSLADLQQQLNNTEAEWSGVSRERGELETELKRRQDQLERMRKTVRESELDREHLSSTLKTLREQIELQKKKVIESTANPEEVRRTEAEVEDIQAESAKLAEKTNKLRAEIMELHDRMEEANKRIAGPYEKGIKEAEEKKKEAEAGINAENAKKSSSERNIKKIKVKLENLDQDVKTAERQLEAALERLSDAENRIGELNEVLEQRKGEHDSAKDALNEFMQSIGEKNEEEVGLQTRVEELKREVKGMDSDIAGLDAKLKSIESKLSKLKFYRTKWILNSLSTEERVTEQPQPTGNDEGVEDSGDEDSDSEEGNPGKRRNGLIIATEPEQDDLEQYLDDCRDEGNVDFENGEEDEDEEMEVDEREGDEEVENDNEGRPGSNVVRPRGMMMSRFFMPLPKLAEQFIRDEVDVDALERKLAELEQRKRKQSPINLRLIEEFMAKVERYEKEINELTLITGQRDLHRAFHDRLKKQRLHEFMEGFQQIATALRTTYQMITIQGDVSLELVDSLDPFAEGIAFNVRPPKKSWKQITNLSGGEKTLASLSLVFGLHQYKPTPLYVMDEIDAALDHRNVSIIANYLLERTRNAQFVVISLRNQMYEKAYRLVGIYKVKDCTMNVTIDPAKIAKVYKEDRQTLKRRSRTADNSLQDTGNTVDV